MIKITFSMVSGKTISAIMTEGEAKRSIDTVAEGQPVSIMADDGEVGMVIFAKSVESIKLSDPGVVK